MKQRPIIRVRDVMSTNVHSLSAMATVRDAIRLMKESRVSSIVVERRDEDDEYGVITIADIAGDVIAEDRSADRVNVYEIMSKPVITVSPDMNIKYAARLLNKFKLTRALVVDEKRHPVGLVTLRDMVLSHADALRPGSDGTEEEEVG